MAIAFPLINKCLAVLALAAGVACVFVKDADKTPIYLLLAYALLRLK